MLLFLYVLMYYSHTIVAKLVLWWSIVEADIWLTFATDFHEQSAIFHEMKLIVSSLP